MLAALALLTLATGFDAAWAAAIPPGTTAHLPAGRYRGPWILAPGASLAAEAGASLEAPVGAVATLDLAGASHVAGLRIVAPPKGFAVRATKGTIELEHLEVQGGAEAAILVREGNLGLADSHIVGGEYGLLAQGPGAIRVERCAFEGQQRDGVAAVSARATISDSSFIGPFSEAAIATTHAPGGAVSRNRLSQVGAVGIKIVNGKTALLQNQVSGARSDPGGLEGFGLYAYGSQVTLDGDAFEDSQGAGLSLSGSQITLSGVSIGHSREAAIYLSSGTLQVHTSRINDSPAGLIVEPGATASVSGFTFVNVGRELVALPP